MAKDVMEVLAAATNGHCDPLVMLDAHDRIAELIAANEEYDAASHEIDQWLFCELNEEGVAAFVRRHKAIERRAAALAAVKEG